MLGFKEYLSLQALAIKKTLAAEKLLLRETVGSFEVKFAEFKSEIQKDITSINASFAAFKSEIQKDIASINASLEGKGEAMVDILNRRSSALAKDMTELTSDLNNKTGNINMLLETMERSMMSNIGDIWTRIVNITMMQNCEAIYRFGIRYDGVYIISPDGQKSFPVFCDMTNGGWTLIQNRIDDSVPFNRTWTEYETGFGDLQGSHWLGLEKIHRLTRNGSQISFDMELVNGSKVYAQYKSFIVDDATTAYTMHVNKSGYNGSIPELLSFHNGMKFSTFDRDNDPVTGSCSHTFGYGGWWYNNCYRLGNLNGAYGIQNYTGFTYYDYKTYCYLKTASIKLKGF